MRRDSQRVKDVGRAALLVPLTALLAAGCTSTGSSTTGSVAQPTHPHSVSVTDVPTTAYLAVVQHYDVPGSAPGQLRYAVTDHKTIAQLAALVNALPAAPDQKNIIIPCPEQTAPAFDLDFQDAKGGKVLAQADFECFGVMVADGARNVPVLSSSVSPGTPSLIDQVEAILAPYAAHAAD